MKWLTLLSFIFLLHFNCFSQDTLYPKHIHSIYAELGGATFIGYSINYEYIFTDYLLREYALRIGGEAIPYKNDSYNYNQHSIIYQLPIEFLLLTGHINSFEFGGGLCPSFGDRFYNSWLGTKYPAYYVHYNYDMTPFYQIGYRYQSVPRNFIFRIDFTQVFLSQKYMAGSQYLNSSQIWAGISFGYCFK